MKAKFWFPHVFLHYSTIAPAIIIMFRFILAFLIFSLCTAQNYVWDYNDNYESPQYNEYHEEKDNPNVMPTVSHATPSAERIKNHTSKKKEQRKNESISQLAEKKTIISLGYIQLG